MGGTSFGHSHQTVRLSRRLHDDIARRSLKALQSVGIQAQTIPSLRSKNTFGDVDLLCRLSQTHQGEPAIPARDVDITAALGAIASRRGSRADRTLSLLINSPSGPVQLDLLSMEDHLFSFARSHLSYGDAGTLASVIARQMGLKLGMNGLYLTRTTRNGQFKAQIDITYAQALALIGLDPDRHSAGFDEVEDVFRWLAAGDYFDPRIWQFHRLTNRARKRALKRPASSAFLVWLKQQDLRCRYDWGTERGARSQEWIRHLSAKYPQAAAALDQQMEAFRQKTASASFFTGKAIREATGAEPHMLPFLMNEIQKRLGKDTIADLERTGRTEIIRETAQLLFRKLYGPATVRA